MHAHNILGIRFHILSPTHSHASRATHTTRIRARPCATRSHARNTSDATLSPIPSFFTNREFVFTPSHFLTYFYNAEPKCNN